MQYSPLRQCSIDIIFPTTGGDQYGPLPSFNLDEESLSHDG